MSDTKRVMRSAFIPALQRVFEEHEECIFVSADDGAPELDVFFTKDNLKDRFVQVGIAEQEMIGFAAGAAKEGLRPYCYSILPFLSTRVHEFVKLNVAAMNLPVTLFGVGAGFSYSQMGASHHCVEDISLMAAIPGLEIWSPSDPATAGALAQLSYDSLTPKYIRLDREPLWDINDLVDLREGRRVFHDHHPDLYIITTGIMTHQAMKVSDALAWLKSRGGVIDVLKIAPFPKDAILEDIGAKPVVVLEEHFAHGGLGSIVSTLLTDNGLTNRLLRIHVPPTYTFESGGRQAIWERYNLTVEAITERIKAWL